MTIITVSVIIDTSSFNIIFLKFWYLALVNYKNQNMLLGKFLQRLVPVCWIIYNKAANIMEKSQ